MTQPDEHPEAAPDRAPEGRKSFGTVLVLAGMALLVAGILYLFCWLHTEKKFWTTKSSSGRNSCGACHSLLR